MAKMPRFHAPEWIWHRPPYGEPKPPMDYDLTAYLFRETSRFETLIDRRVRELQRQGVDISTCQEYLGSVVETRAKNLSTSLENRKHAQIGYINASFTRRAADCVEYNRVMSSLDEEIGKIRAELEVLELMHNEMNPVQQLLRESRKGKEEEDDGQTDA